MSTREKLIEAALDLYSELGEHFSLSQLAKILDMKKQSVYAHFKNKEDLVNVMYKEMTGGYITDVKLMYDDEKNDPIKDQLLALANRCIGTFSEEKSLRSRRWIALNSNHNPMLAAHLVEADKIYHKMVHAILAKGIGDGVIKNADMTVYVDMFIMIIRGIVDNAIPQPLEKKLAVFEGIFEEYWQMIIL